MDSTQIPPNQFVDQTPGVSILQDSGRSTEKGERHLLKNMNLQIENQYRYDYDLENTGARVKRIFLRQQVYLVRSNSGDSQGPEFDAEAEESVQEWHPSDENHAQESGNNLELRVNEPMPTDKIDDFLNNPLRRTDSIYTTHQQPQQTLKSASLRHNSGSCSSFHGMSHGFAGRQSHDGILRSKLTKKAKDINQLPHQAIFNASSAMSQITSHQSGYRKSLSNADPGQLIDSKKGTLGPIQMSVYNASPLENHTAKTNLFNIQLQTQYESTPVMAELNQTQNQNQNQKAVEVIPESYKEEQMQASVPNQIEAYITQQVSQLGQGIAKNKSSEKLQQVEVKRSKWTCRKPPTFSEVFKQDSHQITYGTLTLILLVCGLGLLIGLRNQQQSDQYNNIGCVVLAIVYIIYIIEIFLNCPICPFLMRIYSVADFKEILENLKLQKPEIKIEIICVQDQKNSSKDLEQTTMVKSLQFDVQYQNSATTTVYDNSKVQNHFVELKFSWEAHQRKNLVCQVLQNLEVLRDTEQCTVSLQDLSKQPKLFEKCIVLGEGAYVLLFKIIFVTLTLAGLSLFTRMYVLMHLSIVQCRIHKTIY